MRYLPAVSLLLSLLAPAACMAAEETEQPLEVPVVMEEESQIEFYDLEPVTEFFISEAEPLPIETASVISEEESLSSEAETGTFEEDSFFSEAESAEAYVTEMSLEEIILEETLVEEIVWESPVLEQDDVSQSPVPFSLSVETISLESGDSYPLSWTAPADSAEPVFYSDNPTIVSVTSLGILNAHAPGEAVITASCGDETVVCQVNVRESEEFSLYADTSLGRIYSYTAEDAVYMFLPSSESLTDLVIHAKGPVKSVSGVQYDSASRTIKNVDNHTRFTVRIGTAEEILNVIVLRSSLPSMNIRLNGITLADVHQDKNIKYKGNEVAVFDPSDASNSLEASDVEFKGRGNSSWKGYEKKGYQIKFDKKTSLLGMNKAKKFVLIANASDISLMRNALSLELADQGSFAFTPDLVYADLWIDGNYQGLYTIIEKVELDDNRVALESPYGVLVEMDNYFYEEEEHWYRSEITGAVYVLKEAVTETTTAGFEIFQKTMTAFEAALERRAPYNQLCQYVDMDSFAEFYLYNE